MKKQEGHAVFPLRFNWSKISWIIAVEIALITFIASFFLPGGDDFYRYYYPFANGCLNCAFVPYYARWIFWPLSLLPPRIAWPTWTLLSTVGFIVLCRFTKVNPAIVLLSFPAFGQFWLGQVDIIIAIGLVLGVLASNPYLRGIGLLLALVKPQITGLAVLVLLYSQPRREIIKVLLPSFLTILVSLAVYGIFWPIHWLMHSWQNLPVHVWRLASLDISRYGFVLFFLPFLFKSVHSRFKAGLVVSAIATPFFGVYSYLVFLIFGMPWWSLLLSYAWILMYPLYGKESMRFAWILPIAMLGNLLIQEIGDNGSNSETPNKATA